jgi:hypothetical protein
LREHTWLTTGTLELVVARDEAAVVAWICPSVILKNVGFLVKYHIDDHQRTWETLETEVVAREDAGVVAWICPSVI